jgi:hypothetical protein
MVSAFKVEALRPALLPATTAAAKMGRPSNPFELADSARRMRATVFPEC